MGQLFLKHKANKCPEHGPIYQKLLTPLKNIPINFLEIGVERGNSLRAFHEFLPLANLFGIDIHPKNICNVAHIMCGDQADPDFLRLAIQEVSSLDFIIDDGGHRAIQQQTSFKYLYPILRRGGYYVIEDLYIAENINAIGVAEKSTLKFLRDLDLDMEFHYCQGSAEDVCVIKKP
jgi:hypothetical protein